jgi:di- and tripeptidase
MTVKQWYDLKEKDSRPPPRPILHPSCRSHRFFDSKGPGGVQTPPRPASSGEMNARALGGQTLEIDKEHIVQYAHYGYVYCMLLARGLGGNEPDEEVLISGGGDGTVKLWNLDHKPGGGISEIAELENGDSSVLTIALDGTLLYTGTSEGDVNVWDLDTRQMIRSVKAHTRDVLTLSIGGGLIFSAGESGYAKVGEDLILSGANTNIRRQRFNQKYECIGQWEAHPGLILASAISTYNSRRIYVTGGNDDCVAIWDISDCLPEPVGGSKSSNGKFWRQVT